MWSVLACLKSVIMDIVSVDADRESISESTIVHTACASDRNSILTLTQKGIHWLMQQARRMGWFRALVNEKGHLSLRD